MTTLNQATTHARINAGAPAAARLLRERLKNITDGSNDATAAADMRALATALETAAATSFSRPDWVASSQAVTLTWTTSGANDATTKAALLAWMYGGHGTNGARHRTESPAFGQLGADLLALINQL